MEKYITTQEMVQVFNTFTREVDPTVEMLWVGSASLGGRKIVVAGQKPQKYRWPVPAAEYAFLPPGECLRDWSTEGTPWTSLGYRPEEILEVEFTSASSKSTIRWTRIPCTVEGVTMGVLEYTHGTDPSYRGKYFEAYQKARKAI